MRPLIQQTLRYSWLAVIALVVPSGAIHVCAQEDADHSVAEADTDDGRAPDEHEPAASEHGDVEGVANEDGAHDGHEGVDYNQPPLHFDPKLFLWTLGLFVLFLFVARQLVWTPLIRALDAREARVNRALHGAEAARVEAERLLAEHDARMAEVQEEVKGIVAAARKEAEAEKARIIAEADVEAAALRDRAIAEIEAAHRQAIDDLNAQIDQQAAVATEHVLGRTR